MISIILSQTALDSLWQEFPDQFPRKMGLPKFRFDLVYIAGPKLLGGICTILLNLLLMQRLGPTNFGLYTLCLTLVLLCSEGCVGSAIDMAVLRCATEHRRTGLQSVLQFEFCGLCWKLGLGMAASLVLLIGSGAIGSNVLEVPGHGSLTWLVVAASMASLLHGSGLVHYQIRGQFGRYGFLDGLSALLKFGGIGLTLAFWSRLGHWAGPAAPLAWFALAPFLAFAIFCCCSGFRLPVGIGNWSGILRELSRYVGWNLATYSLTSFISRLDILFLAMFSTPGEMGIFAGAQTLAMIPHLLGSYLAVLWNPKIMGLYQEGRLRDLLRYVQSRLIITAGIVYLVLLGNVDWLLSNFLPASFQASKSVFLILVLSGLAGMTTLPLVVGFLLFLRPTFFLRMELILIPFLVGGYLAVIPRFGAVGAAGVTTAFILLKSIVATWMAFRCSR